MLGSMPGQASLDAGQYYAHPRNLFWAMTEWHLGIDRSLPYTARIEALCACGVALWDVLASCERRGSLDAAIARNSEVANAIPELLADAGGIHAVLLNGRRAESSFRRHVESACLRCRPDLAIHALPSTSPANQSIPLQRRRAAWALLTKWARRPARDPASRSEESSV